MVFALRNSDISTLRLCNWACETSAGESSTCPFHGEISHRLAELSNVRHGYILSFSRRRLSIATILEHSRQPHARQYQKGSMWTEAKSAVLGPLNGTAGSHSWQRVTQRTDLLDCYDSGSLCCGTVDDQDFLACKSVDFYLFSTKMYAKVFLKKHCLVCKVQVLWIRGSQQ